MKNVRTGLGKGLGMGYKNLVPIDTHIHSLSAKGVKSKCPMVKSFQKMPKFKLNAYGQEEPIEVIEEGNLRGEIYYDESPESPREWDNMGKMVAFHKRYDLGDKTDLNSDQFNGWDELEDYLIKEKKARIILPLYLYDHSGISISTGDFGDKWDSGRVGFIYATDKDIKDNYNVKRITSSILSKAKKLLQGEVETYNQFLTGDVYGFKIIEKSPVKIVKTYPDGNVMSSETVDDEELDSCWGFYGMDAVRDEVKGQLAYYKVNPKVK